MSPSKLKRGNQRQYKIQRLKRHAHEHCGKASKVGAWEGKDRKEGIIFY